ncbi:MAG: BamA/TamA family outer membrane protein [Bacteroidales bacterium]|nr:BamA/TamA family outer membrane protein [Bacteroidales bacterium]
MRMPLFSKRFFLCMTLLCAAGCLRVYGQRRDSLAVRLLRSDTLIHFSAQWPRLAHPYTSTSVADYAERCLLFLEDHGYPFAEVRMYRLPADSLSPDSLPAVEVRVTANALIRWDSIVLKGDARLSHRFLYPYLKIRPGQPYREKAVRQAETALAALPYLQPLRPPSPTFTDRAAALYIYADAKNANTFDGYVGFSPKEDASGLQVYGQLQLRLANTFARGESFALDWQHPQKERQSLQCEADFPCLLHTPFGLYGQFSLLKNDTDYYTLSLPFGIRYQLWGQQYLQGYYRYETSRATQAGTVPQKNGIPDYRTQLYGLRVRLGKTDNARIPRRGYVVDVQGEAGQKRLLSESASTLALRALAKEELYLPLGRRWVLAQRFETGCKADPELYESDLFRLGGLHSLRGADEQALRASAYAFLSGEIRWLLDKNAFFQVFTDGGWYEKKGVGDYQRDLPVGIGAGLSLYTKAGLLSLNYAVAAQHGQGFRLRAAKVGIGYSALF